MQKSSSDLFSRIFESSREFKKVTTITTCAMFGALSVVLGYYSFKITPNLKIGFGSIPNMLVDYLFGPVVGGLFGGAMDVLQPYIDAGKLVVPSGQMTKDEVAMERVEMISFSRVPVFAPTVSRALTAQGIFILIRLPVIKARYPPPEPSMGV